MSLFEALQACRDDGDERWADGSHTEKGCDVAVSPAAVADKDVGSLVLLVEARGFSSIWVRGCVEVVGCLYSKEN